MRRAILAFIAWLCLSGGGFAQTPAASTLSFPPLTGRVVDAAGLLSADDVAALDGELAALEAKTSEQLVVATLPSLQGHAIEDYGYQLGRAWQIGQKGKNSGVLLIVAPHEHAVRIEVGYGLEGVLTDAATKVIIETAILPSFKTGDFPGGIRNGAAAIIQLLGGDAAASAPADAAAPVRHESELPGWPIVIFGLFGVGLVVFCAVHGGGVCRGLGQAVLVMAMSGGGRSSSFGGGGGGGGGGGFSGGGGSFGGGGSSGSW